VQTCRSVSIVWALGEVWETAVPEPNNFDLLTCFLTSVVSTYTQQQSCWLCWVRKHSPLGARLEQPVELTRGFLTMWTRLTSPGPLGRNGHRGGEVLHEDCRAMVKMELRGYDRGEEWVWGDGRRSLSVSEVWVWDWKGSLEISESWRRGMMVSGV